MKVVINDKQTELKKYPYLGYVKNLFVLFSEENKGVVINPDSIWVIGEYSESWNEQNFKPFQGELILSND